MVKIVITWSISRYENNNIGLVYTDIQESQPQFENRIMAGVYLRGIMRSTMYQKALFCLP